MCVGVGMGLYLVYLCVQACGSQRLIYVIPQYHPPWVFVVVFEVASLIGLLHAVVAELAVSKPHSLSPLFSGPGITSTYHGLCRLWE